MSDGISSYYDDLCEEWYNKNIEKIEKHRLLSLVFEELVNRIRNGKVGNLSLNEINEFQKLEKQYSLHKIKYDEDSRLLTQEVIDTLKAIYDKQQQKFQR